MPFSFNKYGDRLTGFADVSLVNSNATPTQVQPAIEVDRFCRNGQHPHVSLQNQIATAANACALYRTKQIFAMGDSLVELSSIGSSIAAGDRARYRFAWKSGPYAHALYCIVLLREPTSASATNSYARLDIATNAAGTPAVASQTFVYGPPNSNQGWPYVKMTQNAINVDPNTDYYGTLYDVDYGVVLSCCFFEMASLTDNFNGYNATNNTTHTPILTTQRSLPVTISNDLWQKAGATVWCWSVRDGTAPLTTTSATLKNIIDNSSTGAPTAATPGATIDMTGKDRLTTSGVPCIMKAFIKTSSGAVTGTLYLKDSSNTTIASCATTSTTAGWVSSGAFNLPATTAKYDLQFATTGGTFSLYAVSIWEQG